MKKPLFVIGFLVTIVLLLSIVRVTMVNNISTTGIEYAQLQEEISMYKKQNELLKEQYLQASAFTTIEKKATELGFVPAKSHTYLDASSPLALR